MNTLIKPPCCNGRPEGKTPIYNGDYFVRQVRPFVSVLDDAWTVERIYKIFCQVIEDCDEDTPWSDASHNDRMREAQIIYDKLKSGEAVDVYKECCELLAIYDEEDE